MESLNSGGSVGDARAAWPAGVCAGVVADSSGTGGTAGGLRSGTSAAGFARSLQGAREAAAGASSGAVPPDPAADAGHQKLRQACEAMEGMLWSWVFRQMHEGISSGKGLFDDGPGSTTFREMLDAERGKQMARSGAGTLSGMLYRELSRKMEGTGGEASTGGKTP
jgi:hypothetical protein